MIREQLTTSVADMMSLYNDIGVLLLTKQEFQWLSLSTVPA